MEKIILRKFFEKTGRRLDISKAAEIIRFGGINYKGKFIDLNDEIRNAKIQLSEIITDKAKLIWEDYADFICKVYLCWWGSCFFKRLPRKFKQQYSSNI